MPGWDELAKRLADVAKVPEKLPTAVADDFSTKIAEQFTKEEDAYGNAWAALADSTVRKKGHDRRWDPLESTCRHASLSIL